MRINGDGALKRTTGSGKAYHRWRESQPAATRGDQRTGTGCILPIHDTSVRVYKTVNQHPAMDQIDNDSSDRTGTAGSSTPAVDDEPRSRITAPMGPTPRSQVIRGLVVLLVGCLIAFGIPLITF